MTRLLQLAAFITGLATIGWVAAGYVGTNPVALVVSVLVAAFYLMGSLELQRFQRATSGLAQALGDLAQPPAALSDWLIKLDPTLQNAVRLRIEGERVALPGPTLTPYLAGLLVLLGMLGTFLGMVVTLNGTGLALDSATNLEAIRASLSAPVKGLGLAFGTSVAGVTASAALGLVSALCRRERLLLAQVLDAKIATLLRPFSRQHQRDESFKLMQQQAASLPMLVERVQAMMEAMERHGQTLGERLVADQQHFHRQAETAYQALASSVGQSLQASLGESARVAGATIRPAVEAAMAGIAQETASLHDTIARTAQQQLDGLSTRFDASTHATAALWQAALEEHRVASAGVSAELRNALGQFTHNFEQRSTALVDSVSARLDDTVARHERSGLAMVEHSGQAMATAAATLERHSASLLQTIDQAHARLQADVARRDEERLGAWTGQLESIASSLRHEWQQVGADTVARQQQMTDTLAQTAQEMVTHSEAQARDTIAEVRLIAERDERRTQAWTDSLEAVSATLKQEWQQAGTQTLAQQQQICQTLEQTANAIAARTEAQTQTTLAEVRLIAQRDEQRGQAWAGALEAVTNTLKDEWQKAGAQTLAQQQQICQTLERTANDIAARTDTQTQDTFAQIQRIADRDEQRTQAWTGALENLAASLKDEWQQAGARTLAQQQQICQTLEHTAGQMAAQAQSHAQATIAEISAVMQSAAEAPRIAAEVVAELRQKLADSMARDNTMLEERSRILDTLATLLDAVNHASTEQRAAIDALVATSADLLERVGSRFTEQVGAEGEKLAEVAAQITGSAVEVASLGEAFGFAVQLFSQSNDKQLAQLQRIEAALAKSMARSDEQLAYYVAQAREVIDLTIMSQQQIVDELQQLAGRSAAPVVTEA